MSKDAPQLSASELVNRFRATASPMARRLAGLMATVPVSLPVVHLIQATLLKESMQIHIAEVFMSGLLQPITFYGLTSKSKTVNYKFVEGVRELLIDSVPIPDIDTVLDVVSQYIAQKVGLSIKNFAALLSPSVDWDKKTKEEVIPFAEVTTQVLRRLGGEYAALAEQLDRKSQVIPKFLEVPDNLAQLQTFEFEVATITIEDEVDAEETQTNPAPAINLQTFEFEVATITIIEDEIDGEEIPTTPSVNLQLFNFEVATVKLQKSGWLQLKTELIVERNQHQAQYFVENLGRGVELEMVSIPEGEFRMGTPEREEESRYNEFPQHEVTIKPFFMGKYPITQVQWRAVASLKKVKHSLNPYPSRFTGDNLPVGCVSWLDAVEFCKRLSQYTNRPYRLPSEAEWEYACRAVTITPFHFGETITTDLANYRGTDNEKNKQFGFYGRGLKGIYREETTDVGSFGVANAFGLYDMHGNVWEWCADHWHSSYEGAPTDGSAWVNKDDNDNLVRVLRGGSWYDTPGDCRSASRVSSDLDLIYNDIGFRVAFGV
ncbi:MAG: formylglycine-generating enzyme family protein [Scytonematopsis contorta HA4267-MV1]|nr:formylglycine-generating enzyme family protein [Scytonematopsis contorta HA4267-MV1]